MILPEKTLCVFDIDDTLFHTHARVAVNHTSGSSKFLLPHEFNNYSLQDGESFDFSEFRSGKKFRETAQPIQHLLDQAAYIIHNQHHTSHTILLTARSNFHDMDEFYNTFRDHGFPIDKTEVHLAGNLGAHLKTSESKSIILKKYLLSNKYDKIMIWDDSQANLDALLALNQYNHLVDMQGFWVDKNDNVHPYPLKTLMEAIYIPKESLNISRSMMPQLGSDQDRFIQHLHQQGLKTSKEKVLPRELKATQSEFSPKIVQSLIDREPKLKPAIASREGYIVDGHHRWLKDLNKNPDKHMTIIRVHAGILDVLAHAKTYDGVQYRDLSTSEKRVGARDKIHDKLKKTIREHWEAQEYK